jgi:hypothetical protein
LVGVLGVVAIIGGMRDLKFIRIRFPTSQWQVPQSWKRLPTSVMAACYGFGIGLGILTRIPFASFYFVLLACVGLASSLPALLVMSVYGIARAGTVAVVAGGQAHTPNAYARIERIGLLAPIVGYFDGLLLGTIGGVLLGQLAAALVGRFS